MVVMPDAVDELAGVSAARLKRRHGYGLGLPLSNLF